jgi:hypothetical protein
MVSQEQLLHYWESINVTENVLSEGMLVDLHVSMLGDPDQDYERYCACWIF